GRRCAVSPEDSFTLVLQSFDPLQTLRRHSDLRRGLDPRLAGFRDGGVRPMKNLKPETLRKIDEVIPHYPVKRSAVLPLLHLIQEDVGYIPQEEMHWGAGR